MSVFTVNTQLLPSASAGACAQAGSRSASGAQVLQRASSLLQDAGEFAASVIAGLRRRAGRDRIDSSSRNELRLTRRGRLVFFGLPVMAAALAMLVGVGAWAASSASSGIEGGAGVEEVTVLPGQSLWDIAQEQAPQEDPSQVIADIASLNDLGTSEITPGQHLDVPVYAAR